MSLRIELSEAGTMGGRVFDRVFFFGSAFVAVGVGILALSMPVVVVPLFWAFLVFVEGPHLVATWARTYLDASERARRGRLLMGSLLWLLPGVVAWSVSHALGSRGPLDLFLLFAALWSYHHAVRQLHGVLAIVHHHGSTSISARVWDRRFLHVMLWSAFGLFSIGHPHNRSMFGLPAEPPRVVSMLGVGLLVALLSAYVAYGIFRKVRFSSEDPRPLWYLLGPALGLQLFTMFVVGAFEPLVPHPADPEQAFLATALVGGIVHGANYLAIAAVVGKRRFEGDADASLASWLGRRPLAAYGAFVLVSLGYLALNALRGSLPGLNVFPRGGLVADFFMVLYWGVFFHHYYLDQKIWHVRGDKRLRYELGLGVPS